MISIDSYLHAGGHEVLLVQVWVVEGSAECEVVRGVLRVAGVQEEGDLAPSLAVDRGQPPLQPGHRGRVSDVQQRSHRHVLERTVITVFTRIHVHQKYRKLHHLEPC